MRNQLTFYSFPYRETRLRYRIKLDLYLEIWRGYIYPVNFSFPPFQDDFLTRVSMKIFFGTIHRFRHDDFHVLLYRFSIFLWLLFPSTRFLCSGRLVCHLIALFVQIFTREEKKSRAKRWENERMRFRSASISIGTHRNDNLLAFLSSGRDTPFVRFVVPR